MSITAAMVKQLRERTGVGMMDCKAALSETGGDMEAAIDLLRKSSKLKAERRAERVAAEGRVLALSAEGVAVLLEVNSETDFVARDENFCKFVEAVGKRALEGSANSVEELMDGDLEQRLLELVQKIGENIQVRRFERVSAPTLGCYVHGNGKIASVVGLEGGDEELARNIAMHVAALSPLVATPDDVPEELLDRERKIYMESEDLKGKPQKIQEKIVAGKVRKFQSEISLTTQAYVREPKLSVGKLLQNAKAHLAFFVRYGVGEGIERKEEDFAAEVAAQLES